MAWRDSLDGLLGSAMKDLGVDGLGVVITDGAEPLYRAVFGAWEVDRVVPVYSSSKWLTASTVMALVDRGVLGLEDLIVEHLPWFAENDEAKRTVTLRHCLSLTSGMGGFHESVRDSTLTLEACVRQIASMPLVARPGTELSYGPNGFQVAGLVAERATSQLFGELVEELICLPIGMPSTTFGHTSNPWLAGGAWSSLIDLERFVGAQLTGAPDVLSQAGRLEMRRNHTRSVTVGSTPYPGSGRPYGLGVWLDEVDARGVGTLVSSQGAAGSTPWVDYARGLAGCLLLSGSYIPAYAVYRSIVENTRAMAGPTRA